MFLSSLIRCVKLLILLSRRTTFRPLCSYRMTVFVTNMSFLSVQAILPPGGRSTCPLDRMTRLKDKPLGCSAVDPCRYVTAANSRRLSSPGRRLTPTSTK